MDRVDMSPEIRRIFIDNQPKNIFSGDKLAVLFEERALLLAEENDFVVLRKKLPDDYLNFISNIPTSQILLLQSSDNECELADIVLATQNLDVIKEIVRGSHCKNIIQAYIPDNKIDLIATKLEISVCGREFFWENYKKSDTQRICIKLGLKIIPSIFISQFTDFDSKKVHDFINSHKKIVVKPDVGVGGQSVSLYNNDSSLALSFPAAIIQKFLVAQNEGSIQFIKDSDGWKIYFCETFQNNNKFYGFKYPFSSVLLDEIRLSAQKFLNYFIERYGHDIPSFGIDFIISNNCVYFHDINPRSTGVTYIFSLISHLYGKESLNKIEFMYLQNECKYEYRYAELREKCDKCGLTHISKKLTDGYALLYPGMLEAKIVNILLVSSKGMLNEYRQMINPIISI